MCIILNNIEHCKVKLQEMAESIKNHLLNYTEEQEVKLECVCDTLQGCFKECFDFLNHQSKRIVDSICEGVNRHNFFSMIRRVTFLCSWIKISKNI